MKVNIDLPLKINKNEESITGAKKHIDTLDKKCDEIKKKLSKLEEEFEPIKVKVEDFNVYDILKGGDGADGVKLDAAKALIMNLENKIFKKFALYDEKNKKNDKSLFKMEEDVKNIKALLDNYKQQNQKKDEIIGGIEKKVDEFFQDNNTKIEEITNDIETIKKKVQNELNKGEMQKEFENKLKKLENDIKNMNLSEPKKTDDPSAKVNESLINKKIEELDMGVKGLKYNMNELEKSLNKNINNLDRSLKEKITLIEAELQKKLNSTELKPINDKFYNLEESIKDLNLQIDSFKLFNDKFKSDISTFNARLEYLNGSFLDFQEKLKDNKPNKNLSLDPSNLLDLNAFNDYKKDIASKMEKIKNTIEELNRSINDISTSLSRFVSNKDFLQFQNTLMTLLGEFKINCMKKFMDKYDIQKTFRILENEIKAIADACKKGEGADNWLLAKKPLNNYQCASCEAMLKDLHKNDNYIPWNKYPNREEKSYRMGHGFSRMLQMVNEEIIKSIEKKDKGYVSDEDKKYNKSNNNRSKHNESNGNIENRSIKLPKVIKKNGSKEMYGLTTNKFIMGTSPYDESEIGSADEPRIYKIYKINNTGKKFFGANKLKKDIFNSNNPNLSVTHEKHRVIQFNDLNKDKGDFLQLSMTQPNDKK